MDRPDAGLAGMTAVAARDAIADGTLTAVALVEACLARVAEREPAVQAFAHLDPALALRQAKGADRALAEGRPLGILHGVPVGVKDIADTRDWPTENGTIIDAGRRPDQDAAIIERLKAAGAIVFGKTVTTELAAFGPNQTRNPHDPKRTPGGSSSGSAAAVAAGMVPLAAGTQTNGSVIRPAAFCGVVGFKPTRGLISRHGILPQSPTLDTVGTFGRTIEDAALLADALAGDDARDPSIAGGAPPQFLARARQSLPVAPRLGFVRSHVWEKASAEVRSGFERIAEHLGAHLASVDLPERFSEAHAWHRTINMAELAKSYARYYDAEAARLSPRMRGMIEEGRATSAIAYIAALEGMRELTHALDSVFDRFDAILTPAAAGAAPEGMETGDPAFNTIWTLCNVPAVTLPLLTSPQGMPVGVQLVGRRFEDGRLLAVARWLESALPQR